MEHIMPTSKSYYSNKNWGGNWNTWSRTSRAGYGTSKPANWNATTYSGNSPKFNAARQECQWRMGSYRNVYSQFSGSSKTAFSPTTANKWVRYVNNNFRVYRFTQQQFNKFFGAAGSYGTSFNSPTTIKTFLRRKFGAFIKDVTRGNNNTWLIATSKNVTGRPFTQYNWNTNIG